MIRLSFVVSLLCCLLPQMVAAQNAAQDADPRDVNLDVHLNPHQVLGYESCQKCHASEIGVWKQTPHHTTFMTLHRNPAAKEIAGRLGIESFKTDSNCVKCHYTMQAETR